MLAQLARLQSPAALLCVLAMLAGMLGLVPLAPEAQTLLALVAGALGVKRPSDVAAGMAAEAKAAIDPRDLALVKDKEGGS